ncbi:Fur family transcriptional regulator Irr [Hyphomicrobiales bacterium 4NK60-0047b]|jgi:Fur family iron response transcriptional regulator
MDNMTNTSEFEVSKNNLIDMSEKLRSAGMRPTRQRVALGDLLFKNGDRHVCAEILHEEAVEHKIPVSLATVYNTLNQFRDAGLLREVALVGTRVYFDTNMSDHQHFYLEENAELLDIPNSALSVSGLPEAPEGMEIAGVDIVVRLRPKK